MRTHLRWLIPLALAPLVYVLCVWGAQVITAPARDASSAVTIPPGAALGGLGLLVLGAAVPLILLVIALGQGISVHRRARRRKGHFTRAELSQMGEKQAHAQAWENARAFRRTLLSGNVPASVDQWNVPPYAGERFFAAVPMTYARYYGQDVHYSSGGGFAYGHPAFVIGAMAVSGIANGIARSNARAQAAEQWRDWQTAHVLVSNRRLVVNASGRWLSFDYGAITAVFPEVRELTLVCQFPDSSPLLLQGSHSPLAAIMTTFATHGRDGLARHPSLLALD